MNIVASPDSISVLVRDLIAQDRRIRQLETLSVTNMYIGGLMGIGIGLFIAAIVVAVNEETKKK